MYGLTKIFFTVPTKSATFAYSYLHDSRRNGGNNNLQVNNGGLLTTVFIARWLMYADPYGELLQSGLITNNQMGGDKVVHGVIWLRDLISFRLLIPAHGYLTCVLLLLSSCLPKQ